MADAGGPRALPRPLQMLLNGPPTAQGIIVPAERIPVEIRSQPWPRLTANREVRRQPPARGRRSEIRGQRKKVIRDKSPAIPAADGAIDITGLQSQLFVGTNDTHRFYGGPQKRQYSERRHRCYK